MLRSLWLLLVYASFLGVSGSAPFVATLGYVWVDTFGPQNVAYILLNQIPVAMIMGAVAVGAYLLLDRRSPPPLSVEMALMIAMMIWVSLTMIWAQVPSAAWEKWDWAFKTLAFATFIPFVIRSRIQIEAFAQTYVISLAANFVPFGLKTLVSGGGYGSNLGLVGGNSGLGEGGLLSTVCLMAIPLAIYLSKHGQLIPRIEAIAIRLLVHRWPGFGHRDRHLRAKRPDGDTGSGDVYVDAVQTEAWVWHRHPHRRVSDDLHDIRRLE